jgi:hypothetical protein
MLFAAIDFYTLFAQHQRATHILNYYLERVRIEGYLSIQDEGDHAAGTGLYGAFKRAGMELVSIEDCPRQSREDSRVLRNPGNPDDCEIKMTLKIKPVVAPFVSGLFIGEDASNENYQIVVGGAVLSERIDP